MLMLSKLGGTPTYSITSIVFIYCLILLASLGTISICRMNVAGLEAIFLSSFIHMR